MVPENLQHNPLVAALSDFIASAHESLGELTIEVAPQHILQALGRLKRDLKFERLSSVTGVDRLPAEPRFEIVYHLQSIANNQRLRIKARLSGDSPQIESVVPVYRAADWYERETFDFFGIVFLNHPDLRRIMMPEDWEGYPLRKDYSVTGTRY